MNNLKTSTFIKKSILVITLLFIAQIGFAQLSLDSLKGVWNNHSLPDSVRFEAMSNILYHGKIYSYQDSLAFYAQLMIDEARKRGMDKYLAQGLLWKSNGFMTKNQLSTSLSYIDSATQIYHKIGDDYGVSKCQSWKGSLLFFNGQQEEGLSMVENAFEKMKEANHIRGMYDCAASLIPIYTITGDFSKRLHYADLNLKLAQQIGSWVFLAEAYHAMADVYLALEITNEGDEYHEAALEYSKKSDFKYEEMNIIGHLATIAMKRGNYEKSLEYIEQIIPWHAQFSGEMEMMNVKAKQISVLVRANMFDDANKKIEEFRRDFNDQVMWSEFFMALVDYSEGIILSKSGNPKRGAEMCLKAYNGYLGFNQDSYQLEACECLYEAYKEMGDHKSALKYHEVRIEIQENIQKEEAVKELQRMEFHKLQLADSLAVVEEARLVQEAHEEEIRQEEETRNIAFGVGVLVLLLAGGLYSRLRYVRKSKATLQVEKDRSENLLLNILPEEIAQELKIYGKADARDFDLVSILFTDFKGFTEHSAKLSAAELVNEINHCFEAFDGIMEKYNVEKIKTIGDAYMAAGGLPVPTDDSVKNTVLAALEMQAFISKRKSEMDAAGKPAFEMRVGIHTGPVVAGIVGVKKFQYDIWGDTVNTASRMENSGEVEKVNISQATYELLKDDPDFTFESRGKIEAKGKGEIEMWFVEVRI